MQRIKYNHTELRKHGKGIVNSAVKTPLYHFFRTFGYPVLNPLSLVLCLTHRCNLRCLTCKIYDDPVDELAAEEWEKVFRRIGKGILWFTVTGGEPFIRDDIEQVITSLLTHCAPKFITIPTNGYFCEAAPSIVNSLCNKFPETRFILNISIDAVGADHDAIRRLPGSFDRAVETFRRTATSKPQNMRLGIYTVISKFNIEMIPDLIAYVRNLGPDTHHFEIAQPRRELSMEGVHIAPSGNTFRAISRQIRRNILQSYHQRTDGVIDAFRGEYYRNVEESFCDGKAMP
ncbi:MAG: radical SAM protein, partial [bacterium]